MITTENADAKYKESLTQQILSIMLTFEIHVNIKIWKLKITKITIRIF